MGKRYTIAVDFDGVIHRYDTPWKAAHIIPDKPVDDAIRWLNEMVQKFDVVIFSTRCKSWRGRRAVRKWLQYYSGGLWDQDEHGRYGIEDVELTAVKPPALIYLDDRAMRFEGTFPTAQTIHRALPWHKLVSSPHPAPGEPEHG